MTPFEQQRPLIALTAGDPSGIGPEIVRAALDEPRIRRRMRLVVLGPEAVRPLTTPLVTSTDRPYDTAWWPTTDPGGWKLGQVRAAGGHAALAALRRGAQLAAEGRVDALVTAPVSKEALHLAGEKVEGQTELFTRWSGAPRVQMIAEAKKLREMLLTRHLPLARALEKVRTPAVLDHLRLLHESLRDFGVARPHLALAGLNPHAGEAGLIGSEEQEILEPAVERARAEGLRVTGPVSPDTVFAQGVRGDYDAVLALYHDQAFIPIKLAAPESAFTVLAGLPYLRLSPAHGTAFDIAGQGLASPASLFAALEQAAEWAELRRASATPQLRV